MRLSIVLAVLVSFLAGSGLAEARSRHHHRKHHASAKHHKKARRAASTQMKHSREL